MTCCNIVQGKHEIGCSETILECSRENMQAILDHLVAHNLAWCIVKTQIIDRADCRRYLGGIGL